MKFIFFIFLLTFLSITKVKCQNTNINICSYGEFARDADICRNISWNSPNDNTAAVNAIDRIIAPLGLKRNFILIPCLNIKNCAAVTIKETGLRYIIYDLNFLQNIQTVSGNSWTSLSILAHEIGHHLDGHTLTHTIKSEQRNEELEADEFSGFILFKLGATLYDAQAAMNSIEHPNCYNDINYDHPCKEKRLDAIRAGWNKAKNLNNTQQSTYPPIDNVNSHLNNNNIDDPAQLFELYKSAFNQGIATFNNKDWNSSLNYFSESVKYSDIIFLKKFSVNKTQIFDTTSILYAGYAAQNSHKPEIAIRFYDRLISNNIGGSTYIDIYKYSLIYSINTKNEYAFKKYLNFSKARYPYENWEDYELSYFNKNYSLAEKLEIYDRENAIDNITAKKYLIFGNAFANISKEDEFVLTLAQKESYLKKGADAFKKAYLKVPTDITATFNAGVVYYNIFVLYDDKVSQARRALQELNSERIVEKDPKKKAASDAKYKIQSDALKSQRIELEKPMLEIADSSIIWLEKAFNGLKDKIYRIDEERNIIKKSVEYLSNIYFFKRDKVRGKNQNEFNEYDEKLHYYDNLHGKF